MHQIPPFVGNLKQWFDGVNERKRGGVNCLLLIESNKRFYLSSLHFALMQNEAKNQGLRN